MFYDDEIKQIFAERLRGLREAAGLSQAELGEKLGVSRGSISFYENCERVPDIVFLDRVSVFFGIDHCFLLGSQYKHQSNENIGLTLGLSEKAVETLQEYEIYGEEISAFIEHEHFPKLLELMWSMYLREPYKKSIRNLGVGNFDYQAFQIASVIVGILADIGERKDLGIWAQSLLCKKIANGDHDLEIKLKEARKQIAKKALRNLEEANEDSKASLEKMSSEIMSSIQFDTSNDPDVEARKKAIAYTNSIDAINYKEN